MGGLNDLAAALLMLRRGCLANPVFFDGVSRGTRERAVSLSKELLGFYPRLDLRVVPFGEVQEATGVAPDEFSHPLNVRAMLRASEGIAREAGGDALATGETAWSSQGRALRIFRVEDDAVEIPVFRPLAGLSEARVKWLMQRLGVSEVPISPSALGYPESDVSLEEVRSLERELRIDSLIGYSLEKVEVIKLG